MSAFLSPLNQKRLALFKKNKRGYYSLILFMILFLASLCAEIIANDSPIVFKYQDKTFIPMLFDYYETDLGLEHEISIDYKDPYIKSLLQENGWSLWPIFGYSYQTINYTSEAAAPSPPSRNNILGTDDQGRDVLARLIYGFRLSILFGLILTALSSLIGILSGAIQGYFGGRIDLYFQRFIEVWSGLPTLYILIILSSIITPNFWWLMIILLLFSWTSLVGVVRAEFLRARNLDYVKAAKAIGVSNASIMFKHIFPNAMVATLTFMPFILNGSITTLTALDFLGFGLPAGAPSLGELLAQGKSNIQAPWLGLTAFMVLSIMLSLLIFIGEAVRDAMDPRKILSFNQGNAND